MVGVPERGFNEEAVELGLGQCVGTGLLDGVLGGDNHKRAANSMAHTVDGDHTFFHHLEQCALGLGARAVDLVSENNRGEDRALVELEDALALVVDGHTRDVGGQQVRRELDARIGAIEGVGQCLREHRFTGAREVFEQHVAVGEHGRDDQADDVAFAENGLVDVANEFAEGILEPRCLFLGYGHGVESSFIPVIGCPSW